MVKHRIPPANGHGEIVVRFKKGDRVRTLQGVCGVVRKVRGQRAEIYWGAMDSKEVVSTVPVIELTLDDPVVDR
jgi:preprotein translocase subunit YajC